MKLEEFNFVTLFMLTAKIEFCGSEGFTMVAESPGIDVASEEIRVVEAII